MPILRIGGAALAFLTLLAAAIVLGDNSSWNFSRVQRGEQPAISNPNAARSRIPLGDGKICRELVFDRNSSQILEANDAPCALPSDLTRRSPGNFIWGGSK